MRSLVMPALLLASSLVVTACPEPPPADAGEGEGEGEGEEDAGPPDAGPSGCGDITPEGECNGTEVSYCDTDDDSVVSYDCGDFLSSSCGVINADYGVDCQNDPGEACAFYDENNDFIWIFCTGTEPACFESNETYECVENRGTCAEEDIGSCDGNLLLWTCTQTQPFLIDCASYGGACSDTLEACVDLPVGSICDDELYVCGAGLDCQAGTCIGLGVDGGPGDDAGADVDAGGGDDDAGAADAG